jgi:hypothetical protein
MLERRLQHAQQNIPPAREHKTNNDTAQTLAAPMPGTKAAKRLEAQEIDDLVSDFGYLSVYPLLHAHSLADLQ